MTESLEFPIRASAPLLLHMTVCTAKVHKVMEFDTVKLEQFTKVLSVVFGHLPHFSDRML